VGWAVGCAVGAEVGDAVGWRVGLGVGPEVKLDSVGAVVFEPRTPLEQQPLTMKICGGTDLLTLDASELPPAVALKGEIEHKCDMRPHPMTATVKMKPVIAAAPKMARFRKFLSWVNLVPKFFQLRLEFKASRSMSMASISKHSISIT
jgi:hypothetical protein